jgi:hypothetical protein
MKRDDRDDPTLVTTAQQTAVVVQRCLRELSLRWLDATPLDREPVGAEPQPLDQVEVFPPPVVGVTGISTRLNTDRTRCVLELPPVAVGVPAFDLVGGTCHPPQESVWELRRLSHV